MRRGNTVLCRNAKYVCRSRHQGKGCVERGWTTHLYVCRKNLCHRPALSIQQDTLNIPRTGSCYYSQKWTQVSVSVGGRAERGANAVLYTEERITASKRRRGTGLRYTTGSAGGVSRLASAQLRFSPVSFPLKRV